MSNNTDFLSAMVEETFALVHEDSLIEPVQTTLPHEEISPTLGLLFNTQIRAPFFVLKTYSTLDAQSDLCFLAREHERKFWGVFPTTHEAQTASLLEKFSNRRFLLNDCDSDALDPGQDWWFDTLNDGFIVHFKRPPLITPEIKNIGPLGEATKFSKMFAEWIPFWETLFPNARVNAGRGSFGICGIKVTRVLGVMKQLFLNGECDEEFFTALKKTDSPGLAVMFEDVALTRKFWFFLKNHLSSCSR